MSTWQVTAGGCGGPDTTRTVTADAMVIDMGCLVFYMEGGFIKLAIGVGYWKDVEPVQSEEEA